MALVPLLHGVGNAKDARRFLLRGVGSVGQWGGGGLVALLGMVASPLQGIPAVLDVIVAPSWHLGGNLGPSIIRRYKGGK